MLWHDISLLHPLKATDPSQLGLLAGITGALEILAGAAVLWPRTARAGLCVLGAIYLLFALLGLPSIVRHPLIYNGYGNVFEQLSLVCGAVIAFDLTGRWAKFAYHAFGICVVSFGLEQLFYLAATAAFVPKWIPPGQMFWAIATTVAFELAAVALLTGIKARLAAQLTAAMLAGFGLLVWVPALFANPHEVQNWTESFETLAITATAWIVVEYLRLRHAHASTSSA